MKFLKNIKEWHILTVLGLIVLGYVIYEYSIKKSITISSMQNMAVAQVGGGQMPSPSTPAMPATSATPSSGSVEPSSSTILDSGLDPASVSESTSSTPGSLTGGGCIKQDLLNPQDLLPKSVSNTFSSALVTDNDLTKVNLLNANELIGINTVGSSLRNANLQLRSEPPNPRIPNLCPWNNSTIEPDTNRLPLEIGCKC